MTEQIISCRRGCGAVLPRFDARGRERQYANHHHMRGKVRPDRARPLSMNKRTGRWRARLMVKPEGMPCALEHIGGCGKAHHMEIHHRDGNQMNNAPENLVALCSSHHKLVERGRIDLANPVMPSFYVSSGKRRYPWLIGRRSGSAGVREIALSAGAA